MLWTPSLVSPVTFVVAIHVASQMIWTGFHCLLEVSTWKRNSCMAIWPSTWQSSLQLEIPRDVRACIGAIHPALFFLDLCLACPMLPARQSERPSIKAKSFVTASSSRMSICWRTILLSCATVVDSFLFHPCGFSADRSVRVYGCRTVKFLVSANGDPYSAAKLIYAYSRLFVDNLFHNVKDAGEYLKKKIPKMEL